ncbi:lycopene cyclase domain-containing protein [Cnuibacter sp. UC19_7]|uniref:lycopene cyclase domain-containing protein n=1 Tax=Cnuibacter sp. UC19_7 TaxID=3350166 RepID=UPI0036721FDA
MGFLYLCALLISIGGMITLDRRFRLFVFAGVPWRAIAVLVTGVVFFLVWDLFGIGLGVFFRGETAFMTGLVIAPELPVEEVFFLLLLCYLTMVVFCAARRMLAARLPRTRAGERA